MQVVEQNNIIITWWSASHESMLDVTLKFCTSISFFVIYNYHFASSAKECLVLKWDSSWQVVDKWDKQNTRSKYCRGPFETPEMTDHQSEFLQITSLISSPPPLPPTTRYKPNQNPLQHMRCALKNLLIDDFTGWTVFSFPQSILWYELNSVPIYSIMAQ